MCNDEPVLLLLLLLMNDDINDEVMMINDIDINDNEKAMTNDKCVYKQTNVINDV